MASPEEGEVVFYGGIIFRDLSFPDLPLGEIPPAGAEMRRGKGLPGIGQQKRTALKSQVTKSNLTGGILFRDN
jgi:hypothetical protein